MTRLWNDVATEARALRDAGDLNAAIAVLERDRDAFPRQLGLTLLLEAELLIASGRTDVAFATLDDALARGCRYRREWILSNPLLAPVRSDPRLDDFADRAQRAYDEASATVKPHLMFAMPDTLPDAFGYPLLMVLHGNNVTASETAPFWTKMADAGWVVAVPRSSEIGVSPDTYVWSDRERAATELDLHLDRVKRATQIDTSRIVLAGFSMGATHAIGLALTRRFVVRGFIAVAAWLPHIREFSGLIAGGAGKMLRGYVLVGERDESRDGARDLVAAMTERGLRAKLDERADLGHEYPADMHETLAAALEFATK